MKSLSMITYAIPIEMSERLVDLSVTSQTRQLVRQLKGALTYDQIITQLVNEKTSANAAKQPAPVLEPHYSKEDSK